MAGTLIIIFQYMERADSVLSTAAELFNKLAVQYTDCASVKPIEKYYNGYLERLENKTKLLEVRSGEIIFKDIHFRYNNQKGVLNDLNLHVCAKEKIGLVGESGAGKSTLINLLLSAYEPTSGKVMVDGVNIKKVMRSSLVKNISLIPQDATLFEGSIFENIQYGMIEASEEGIISAAKKAHLHEFIVSLPHKYQTLVGERGIKLSGGQRQRIAIARAVLKDAPILVKDAPILVLDEATSALDTESEDVIQDSLKNAMQDKTVIAIAHRLSTLKHMDRILVMEHGQIIESGTHTELLDKKGTYSKLWNKQFEGFL